MSPGPPPRSLTTLAELVRRRAGLHFPPGRLEDLERGLQQALREDGERDIDRLVGRLERDLDSLDALIEKLTIHETYFFRHAAQFDFLRACLPRILAHRPSGHELRLWCAGCATGEEAYSLAILLLEEGLQARSTILGSDLSRPALAHARRAAYRHWSLRESSPQFITRYFDLRDGLFHLIGSIRDCVKFSQINLAREAYPTVPGGTSEQDFILCRNVLLYFDAATTQEVARRLYNSLASGGWLITGPGDPPLGQLAPWETVTTPAGVFYQRIDKRKLAPVPAMLPGPPFRLPQHSIPAPVAPPRLSDATPHERAQRLFAAGRYDEAAELARKQAEDPACMALLIRALTNAGGTLVAERAARDAVARHPLACELYFLHAVLLLGMDRLEEAAAQARRAVFLDADLVIGHFLLGMVHRRRGNAAAARRAYRQAASLCSRLADDCELPLSDGQTAGQIRMAVSAELQAMAHERETP